MMQIFKTKKEGFKEIRNQVLIKMFFIIIPILIIVGISRPDISPMVIFLITVPLGFGFYRSINTQKSLFESYTLTISNDLIKREQLNMPTISIHFNDVKEIVKLPNGSFIIKGKETSDLIIVFAQIDNYSQLETALQQIQPIIIKNEVSFFQKYQSIGIVLLIVGLIFCAYMTNNEVVLAALAIIFLVLMVWSFIKIQNNKNIDNATKKGSWLIIIILGLILLSFIAGKLFETV